MTKKQTDSDIINDLCCHVFEVLGIKLLYEALSGSLFIIPDEVYNSLLNGFSEKKLSDYLIQHDMQKCIEYCKLSKSKSALPIPKIKSVTLHICHDCNLSCSYCYGNHGKYSYEGYMSERVAYKAIDFILQNTSTTKKIRVSFFGGEPLLNFNLIKKAVLYIIKQKPNDLEISFHITTNGTLMTDDIEAFLKEHDFSIMFSIDGDSVTHNELRRFPNGDGSFDIIYSNVRKFLKTYPYDKLISRITITKKNLDVLNLIESISKIGFERINTACVFSKDNSIRLNKEDYTQLIATYYNFIQNRVEHNDSSTKLFLPVINKIIKRILFKRKKTRHCNAGIYAFTISPRGDIYSCHRAVGNPYFMLGNIFYDNFSNIKNNHFITLNVDTRPICNRCWARYICGGNCFQESYINNKSYYPIEESCFYIKKIIELALYLSSIPSIVKYIEKELRIAPPF